MQLSGVPRGSWLVGGETHFLELAGFETYLPRLREQRTVRGRRVDLEPPLFPGYIFVWIAPPAGAPGSST